MTSSIPAVARNLLLQEHLSDADAHHLLAPVGFADVPAAYRRLQRIAHTDETRLALADSLPHLLTALSTAANPDQVLVNFGRLAHDAASQLDLFHHLARNPRVIDILVTLFAGSQFLTEILLRHPAYFDRLTAHHRLAQPKSAAQLHAEAQAALVPLLPEAGSFDPLPLLDALRQFQRWELLRIGLSDLLDAFDLPAVTGQLSALADSLAQACLTLAARQTNTSPADFVVIAMGKLGGEELNYSSDIDLLFLAESSPTDYYRLAQHLIDALARMTAEGFLYRVDMRLRPWGRDGLLVSSLDGYMAYLQKNARLWEKQALLKARVIAGSPALGQEFLRRAEPLIFDTAADTIQTEIHALKQRIEERLRQRGEEWGEVKLGQGSIRDIEFVTQYLQLAHGGRSPEIRSPNTLDALARLFAARLLPADEYRVLVDGYTFLRTIEHHLQLKHYRQTHTLPTDREAITQLAQRLGFQGSEAGDNFIARYRQHSAVIRAVYQRHLGHEAKNDQNTGQTLPDLLPLLVRMPPAYVTAFNEADIAYHARLMEQLDEHHLVKVEAAPLDNGLWRVTIVGYDYLGELSLICGLLFVYGFNIIDGHVFTYGPHPDAERVKGRPEPVKGRLWRRRHQATPTAEPDSSRKIVDVFTVRPVLGQVDADCWTRYAADLADLMGDLQTGEQREAQGKLAKRVAVALRDMRGVASTLYPVDIDIDNEAAERHTVLRISATDTIGFLYELTNALALNGINIRRMVVDSVGSRVRDTLYVTDGKRQKITSLAKQRELRVATVLIKHFTHLLPHSPNPEQALLHFRELVSQLFTRSDWPDALTSLEQPEVLNTLARLLGVSEFLWKDFLRMQYANLFPVVRDAAGLAAAKSKAQLHAELMTLLSTAADPHETLNAFKDREMFRIDMRHIQGLSTEFGQFSGELTDLAEVVVEAAYTLCLAEVQADYGQPLLHDGQPCPVSVCGLGKCGGRELGFASDIELMFIFTGNGYTTGPAVTTTGEFYDKLVHAVNQTIQVRQKGIFEIDLQLRPYGKAGSMAVSLDSFRRYFAPGGDAWAYERQALVKLRPIAGDEELGRQVVSLRDEFIYSGQPFDAAAMRAMRERQIRHLVTAGAINAKFSPGGLVDVEYLVQGLQITHGHRDPRLRLTHTGQAMTMLAEAGILAAEDYALLRQAHIFLRRLINALRMVRGNAKDLTVPSPASEEFAFLARRLSYDSPNQLQADLSRHITQVQEISQRLLG